MKIAPTPVTALPPSPNDLKLETAPVQPTVAAMLADYLSRNPGQVLFQGPMGAVPQKEGWKLGSPLKVGSGLSFRPIAAFPAANLSSQHATAPASTPMTSRVALSSDLTKYLHPSAPATNQAQGSTPAQQPTSRQRPNAGAVLAVTGLAAEALRNPVEELAKAHPGLDSSLSVLGVLVATPRAWEAIQNRATKSKVEILLAESQLAVSVAEALSSFIPPLHSAKPALTWAGVLLKSGDSVYAMCVKPASAPAQTGLGRGRGVGASQGR